MTISDRGTENLSVRGTENVSDPPFGSPGTGLRELSYETLRTFARAVLDGYETECIGDIDGWWLEKKALELGLLVECSGGYGLLPALSIDAPLAHAPDAGLRIGNLEFPDAGLRAWHPIETAPQDGTRIQLYYANRGGISEIGMWRNEIRVGRHVVTGWRYIRSHSAAYDLEHQPTHWMPSPVPPDAALARLPERERT